MSSPDADSVTGSCLCRAVTYKATGKPMFRTLCHCLNCRKVSGAPMMGSSVYTTQVSPFSSAPRHCIDIDCLLVSQQITFSGEQHKRIYDDEATDSGHAYRRHFCSRCGAQLGGQSAAFEQFFAINQGSLDAEYVNDWAPDVEQYCVSKARFLPWFVERGGEGEMRGRFERFISGPRPE
ncbi:hypothetical protein ANO11243_014010 [Dothideomycetidae sp. 11243]|nr:hypothetical protein ANO11243_014010 [fungal sp. No.11243]